MIATAELTHAVRDHDGTTEPLAGLSSVSVRSACGKTWPTRFGAGAETVRIVRKASDGA